MFSINAARLLETRGRSQSGNVFIAYFAVLLLISPQPPLPLPSPIRPMSSLVLLLSLLLSPSPLILGLPYPHLHLLLSPSPLILGLPYLHLLLQLPRLPVPASTQQPFREGKRLQLPAKISPRKMSHVSRSKRGQRSRLPRTVPRLLSQGRIRLEGPWIVLLMLLGNALRSIKYSYVRVNSSQCNHTPPLHRISRS